MCRRVTSISWSADTAFNGIAFVLYLKGKCSFPVIHSPESSVRAQVYHNIADYRPVYINLYFSLIIH